MKAFPDSHMCNNEGMDLRDYFAAKAMQSLVNNEEVYPEDEICSYAYKIADQMMKTREK
jgi:hypothetical protein